MKIASVDATVRRVCGNVPAHRTAPAGRRARFKAGRWRRSSARRIASWPFQSASATMARALLPEQAHANRNARCARSARPPSPNRRQHRRRDGAVQRRQRQVGDGGRAPSPIGVAVPLRFVLMSAGSSRRTSLRSAGEVISRTRKSRCCSVAQRQVEPFAGTINGCASQHPGCCRPPAPPARSCAIAENQPGVALGRVLFELLRQAGNRAGADRAAGAQWRARHRSMCRSPPAGRRAQPCRPRARTVAAPAAGQANWRREPGASPLSIGIGDSGFSNANASRPETIKRICGSTNSVAVVVPSTPASDIGELLASLARGRHRTDPDAKATLTRTAADRPAIKRTIRPCCASTPASSSRRETGPGFVAASWRSHPDHAHGDPCWPADCRAGASRERPRRGADLSEHRLVARTRQRRARAGVTTFLSRLALGVWPIASCRATPGTKISIARAGSPTCWKSTASRSVTAGSWR